MKVLYLVSGVGPPAAWGSEYIQNTIIKMSQAGVDCTILSPIYLHTSKGYAKWVKEQENKYKIRIITISSNKFITSNFLLHLALTPIIITCHTIRLLLKEKFDVVHEFTSSPIILIRTFIVKVFFKTPSVVSICAYNNTVLGNIFWIKMLNCAKKYLLPSKSMYDKLISYGVNQEKCLYFPPGIKIENFGNKIEEGVARKLFNLPNDKFIFSFFGPLTFEKGVDDILKAIGLLKTEDKSGMLFLFYTQPSIRFGKNKMIPECKFKHANQIVLKKGLTDINSLISASDCVILPQRTGHGTTIPPISVIEVLVKERPLIITETIGNEDLSNYKNVFLAKPASPFSLSKKILDVYKQYSKTDGMVDRTIVEKTDRYKLFDLNAQSKLLLDVYKSVLLK